MTDGCRSRPANHHLELECITTAVQVKYKVNLHYDSDGKVKWLVQFDGLKQFVNDILQEDGKWSSPGGKAKSFHTEKVTITWYADKKTLLFQGSVGNMLKEHIINLLKSDGGTLERRSRNDFGKSSPSSVNRNEETFESTEYGRLSVEMAEAKLEIEILLVIFNRFCDSLKAMEKFYKNYVAEKRDISTQTSIVFLSVPNEENNSNILSTELFDSEEEIDCTNGALQILEKTGSDIRVQTKVREQSNRNIINNQLSCQEENRRSKIENIISPTTFETQLREYREKQNHIFIRNSNLRNQSRKVNGNRSHTSIRKYPSYCSKNRKTARNNSSARSWFAVSGNSKNAATNNNPWQNNLKGYRRVSSSVYQNNQNMAREHNIDRNTNVVSDSSQINAYFNNHRPSLLNRPNDQMYYTNFRW